MDLRNKKMWILGTAGLAIAGLLMFSTSSNSVGLGDPLYKSVTTGEPGTLSFRRYFLGVRGNKISPWHHIPLKPADAPSDVFNFVCEIPKGARAKMEINKEAEYNPFIQDVKKGALRFYHSDSLVNYGAFPQTWEDGDHKDTESGLLGDNDPLDVIDIGKTSCTSGDVYQVKVLGILGMVDGGEMDWKVVTVAVSDPLAAILDDVGADAPDRNEPVQAFLSLVRVWFRDYKLPDGKPPNEFAFEGAYLPKSRAIAVVSEQHELWRALAARDHSTAATAQGKAYNGFWWGSPAAIPA